MWISWSYTRHVGLYFAHWALNLASQRLECVGKRNTLRPSPWSPSPMWHVFGHVGGQPSVLDSNDIVDDDGDYDDDDDGNHFVFVSSIAICRTRLSGR